VPTLLYVCVEEDVEAWGVKEVCECRSCRGNVGVCVEVDGGWERGMWASRDVVEDERRRGEVMGVCEEGY
jgi:hypothetical protein